MLIFRGNEWHKGMSPEQLFDSLYMVLELLKGCDLRRKLDEPFGKQLIETIRGAGYRLDPEGG
jgi:hypothetical protein